MLIAIIAGIYAMLALWFAWLIARAPEGYEDERGWHAGRPDDEGGE